MQHSSRRVIEEAACVRRYALADAKGAEYSGAGASYRENGADVLANFKSVAERIGGTPEQVLMTYLLKHIDSINTTVREGAAPLPHTHNVYAAGEGIVSRMDDARNYLDLLECLLIDNYHITGEGIITAPDAKSFIAALNAEMDEVAEADRLIREHHPLANDPKGIDWDSKIEQSEEALRKSGLVEGLDGVWRGATTIHESVRNPGERQVPIFAQPTQDSVRGEDVTSTGELA